MEANLRNGVRISSSAFSLSDRGGVGDCRAGLERRQSGCTQNPQIAHDRYINAMLHVALHEPEIPPNAGNVARLCAATGTRLHLIGRLGFRLDDKHLKRAGLDYWPHVDLKRHATWEDFLKEELNVWLIECPSERPYTQAEFADGDCLLFGSESKGVPPSLCETYAARTLGIPMPTGTVRSLNLATSVGIALYEALRQVHRW